MKSIFALSIFIPTFLISMVACVSLKKSSVNPFVIRKATYYSWVTKENEKGTTIKIDIDGAEKAIQFDSLIFRNVLLPVRTSESEEKTDSKTIIAILPSGESKIRINTQHIEKPDQLIYHYKGERGVFPLKNIVRKNMIYY